jgi:hypothetical protein
VELLIDRMALAPPADPRSPNRGRVVAYFDLGIYDAGTGLTFWHFNIKLLRLDGRLMAVFPSRKITGRCGRCAMTNAIDANYCNLCGLRLYPQPPKLNDRGRPVLYRDVCSPGDPPTRAAVERAARRAYIALLRAGAGRVEGQGSSRPELMGA